MPQDGSTLEILNVETPESVAFAYEFAGLGSRGLALALDGLLIGLMILGEVALAAIVFAVLSWAMGADSSSTAAGAGEAARAAGPWIVAVTVVAMSLTGWAYFVYGEVVRGGRTWGKRKLGLRVVRGDGSRVGLLDSLIRNFLRIVDMLPGNYAVGMAGILLSSRRQRLGDMAAGTVVVRDPGDLSETFEGPQVSEAALLGREFLERRHDMTPAARRQVGTEVLRALGEEADPSWDEAQVAGRIAHLVR